MSTTKRDPEPDDIVDRRALDEPILRQRHLWEEMTSPELQARCASGAAALIPVGSCEQHGPHLPMSTDTIMAFAVAVNAAIRCDAVVLPPISVSPSPGHDRPGTLSVPAHAFHGVLETSLDQCAAIGLAPIIVVCLHRPAHVACLDVCQRRIGGSPVIVVSPYATARRHLEEAGFQLEPAHPAPHGGQFETSIVAAWDAPAVRWDRLPPREAYETVDRLANGWAILSPDDVSIGAQPAVYVREQATYAPQGFAGRPDLATAELGRKSIAVMAAVTARIAREAPVG